MLFFFYGSDAQQVNDTLKEVKVKSRKRQPQVSGDARINTYSPGQKVITLDSLTLQQYKFQTVANLLSQQVPVFVKSYGFNTLATLNFRGASAAQSQVYWNGVPLQNAALGMADVSLLPVALMNKVNIVYGGSSALWGSGNVGGALMLESAAPVFDSNVSYEHGASIAVGSFWQSQLGLQSAVHLKRWSFNVNASLQQADNDFHYNDNGIDRQITNSKLRSGVVILDAAYKIDRKNVLAFTGWYQDYYREIPAAIFESLSVKNQKDRSARFLASWTNDGAKIKKYAKASYMRDYMLFADTVIGLTSNNITNQVYGELGMNLKMKRNNQLTLFVPVQIAWIDRKSLGDMHTQNRVALAGAYLHSFLNDKLNISISARGEVINDKQIFLPGANASYSLTKWLLLRGNLQRSYRAPTLNELYYIPGGNDKLKPEQGWSQELGYRLKVNEEGALRLKHDATVFNRQINDWIIWFGGAIFTPHNVASVHSRGIETENTLNYDVAKLKLHAGLNTSYILATTVESYVANDGSIGKQIPYTPRYNAQGNIGFTFKSVYFNYNHTYTGYRFITIDESQYILPYNTGNIQLLYTLNVGSAPLQFIAQCNNVWNSRYAVVNGRPMPGTNWLAGVKATWKH